MRVDSLRRLPELAATGHTHVCREPALPCALQKGAEATDFGLVPFPLGGFHLTSKREKALMQRDLLSSGLVAVVERSSHRRNLA